MATNTNIVTESSFTRRQFIQSNRAAALAAATYPTIIPASALGRDSQLAPFNRITL